jgi:membrane protein
MARHLGRIVVWTAAMAAAVVAGFGAGRLAEAEAAPAVAKRDWIDFTWRLYQRISNHRATSIAAGVAFFVLLAIFPATGALVSIYGLFTDASALSGQLAAMSQILPGGAIDIVGAQMARVIDQHNTTLHVTFVIGLTTSLWSANAGMKALFDALNIIHGETESRGFVRLNLVSLACTVGLIAFALLAVAALVVLPLLLQFVGIGDRGTELLLSWGRWPMLVVAVALILALIYRFGPSRPPARWRWITPGSALASFAWLAASALFSWYAANFGNFNATYGTLGAAIGFMIWLWLSMTIVLIGAELDALLECDNRAAAAHPERFPSASPSPRPAE